MTCCPALIALLLLAAQTPQVTPKYKISGRADTSTLVQLLTANSARAVNTSRSPYFEFTGVAPGAYTVRPKRPGCAFEPAERTVTVSDADVTGVDFSIRCQTGIPKEGGGPGPQPH